MALLAQDTYYIKRIVKESYRFEITPETISLPSKADGSETDFSTAQTFLKLSYDGKEIYPNYDERLEDWTPAPEDLDTQINAALIKQNCEATVENGVLSVTNFTAIAGYIDIPMEYGDFKQTKRLTLAKSRQGDGVEGGGNITFFAKPAEYKKGDRWILIEDTELNGNFYEKGQALEAVYATGEDSDWRLLVFTDETEGVNLIRNYSFKEQKNIVGGVVTTIIPHWGSTPKEAIVSLTDAIPTEYYSTQLNILGDEYGSSYGLTTEDAEIIILDE